MFKIKLFILLLLLAVLNFNTTVQGQINTPNDDAQQKLNTVDKQFFIENKGQWPSEVLYLTQMGGLNTWITTKGMMYEFYKFEEIKEKATTDDMPNKFEQVEYKKWGHRVAYKLLGNNVLVNTQGEQKQEGYYNYLIGNDLSKHASNVGLYKEALVKDVYTGIDVRYYFDKGLLRYDYIVHPGADPSQIRFSLDGSDKTYLNEQGELVFTTCFGEVKNADLYCYQQQDKKTVNAKFTKQGESWEIELGSYDKNQTLIIDPLIYSTYIGGSDTDWGNAITLDASGNAYIIGQSQSTNYDVTPGVFQTIYGGGLYDVFVTKLNASGTALIYSTYIGGSGEDDGHSIAIDTSGNAFVTGNTGSIDYGITPGAYQTSNGGDWDVFVTKLNVSGTALIYSTYIGGSGGDGAYSIVPDAIGDTYITGFTGSTNYDITVGAFQTINAGFTDVFVTKLNATGSALIYSTYIGGNMHDLGHSIVLDASNNAYITGYTYSTNYDITAGVFQTTNAGNSDVFVTKLNATGTALIYSTYIGGNSLDGGFSITLDTLGYSYITGYTKSSNYDITAGVFQTTFAGNEDIFVTKLNATGTALIYSTYIGGSSNERGYSIALDTSNNVYITGYTASANYDITAGTFQTTNAGGGDVFVTKLNPIGTALLYSTYIGGSGNDSGNAIAIDTSGNAYITGYTQSTDYDITVGAFQTIFASGSNDVFVTKLGLFPCLQTTSSDIIIACDSLLWINGNTYYSSTNTPALIFTNSIGCDSVVTLNLTIRNSTSSTDVVTACDSITWIDGITYTSNTNTPTFTLTNAAGCDSVVTLNLSVNNSNTGTDIQTACDSLTWIDGITYTTSTNTPTFTLTNATGCDSVVTLNLSISNSTSSTDLVTACDSITWIDGITYISNTNTPTFNLTNAAGCDSVVTLNLTITNNDTSITQNINTLTVGATGATYQWLDCNNSNAIITGETNQSYIPASSGNYAVVVSKNGCTDTSACINFIISGINDLEKSYVKISPNPTTAEFIIELASFSPKTQLSIVSVEGKIVYTNNTINVNKIVINAADWSKGIYMVKITDKQSSQVVKLIKQ